MAEQVPDDGLEPLHPDWASPVPGFVGSIGIPLRNFMLGLGDASKAGSRQEDSCGC